MINNRFVVDKIPIWLALISIQCTSANTMNICSSGIDFSSVNGQNMINKLCFCRLLVWDYKLQIVRKFDQSLENG